jgi:hypothetical protein
MIVVDAQWKLFFTQVTPTFKGGWKNLFEGLHRSLVFIFAIPAASRRIFLECSAIRTAREILQIQKSSTLNTWTHFKNS